MLLTSFRSAISLVGNDAELIHFVKEEPLPTDMLLGLLHLRDNDQASNGILSLELRTYVRCATEGVHEGKQQRDAFLLHLCPAEERFDLLSP